MEWDYTWREPTEAQIAALKHAHHCLGGKDEDNADYREDGDDEQEGSPQRIENMTLPRFIHPGR